jgi:hypothetical protein
MKHPEYTGEGKSPFPDMSSVPTPRVQVNLLLNFYT